MEKMPAVVVMGVSGCGKSSVGQAISDAVNGTMIEGDAFHPEENIKKMSAGHPLTDEDRAGWLDSLATILSDAVKNGERPVLACSALKKSYRDILRSKTPGLGFVFLELTREVAGERVSHRPDHFMPASLIDSQFATLEPPHGEANIYAVDATLPIAEIARGAVAWWEHTSLADGQPMQPTGA
ncbi:MULTISPECIES: gluconokinase [unclassified Rhizobium]|uniref:gluconokinase n=1 Tax=unclassified Rhizobium TaxID=2613769 RepID=UPI00104B9E22|nr:MULTISPECIES: gluconokinase [unclassified Rhizobium]MBB3395347.1 gluconokinase [Rhizobium sp. BK060]MBB4168972.1 gluconokinase [Rhizobium sp. BK538]TCM77155.1 gluconate kinase (SKI family) [Rhizobium sp. BK068]